jgi:hypothetical protein
MPTSMKAAKQLWREPIHAAGVGGALSPTLMLKSPGRRLGPGANRGPSRVSLFPKALQDKDPSVIQVRHAGSETGHDDRVIGRLVPLFRHRTSSSNQRAQVIDTGDGVPPDKEQRVWFSVARVVRRAATLGVALPALRLTRDGAGFPSPGCGALGKIPDPRPTAVHP